MSTKNQVNRDSCERDDVIEAYTEGFCWSLAWHLHRLGGWPVYVAGPNRRWWEHVFVKVGRDRYLDATGIRTGAEMRRAWSGCGIYEYGHFPSRKDYLRKLTDYEDGAALDRDTNPQRTVAVAKRLMRLAA